MKMKLIMIGMVALAGQITAQMPNPDNTPELEYGQVEVTTQQVQWQNMVPEGVDVLVTTIITDMQLDIKGGSVVWECPPGHTPQTGGCNSQTVGTTGCNVVTQHFLRRYDNVPCTGLPHVFPTVTYFIGGVDGKTWPGPDWTPIWEGTVFCFGQQYTIRTRDRIVYPPCSASPTPSPTPTPTPTPSPTATPLPPSPTPIVCGPGSHPCQSQWYCGDPSCGCYWTRPICCPDGYECRIHFLWFTCYNMGCCDNNGCIVNGVEVSAFDIMKAEMIHKR